jgi:hypothetical protein
VWVRPLLGSCLTIDQQRLSGIYAASLLRSLGAQIAGTGIDGSTIAIERYAWHAACDWAASGLMPLTGWPQHPPMQGPGAIASCADGALLALQLLADTTLPASLRGACLLSERAALLGLTRGGQVSPNGSCHLLQAADGWMALNLARNDDWALLPAWLQCDADVSDWLAVAGIVRDRSLAVLLERGRLMGLPVAAAQQRQRGEVRPWYRVHWQHKLDNSTSRSTRQRDGSPLIVDLSSLWAGPLCSHLLSLAGGSVIKVESLRRPDGARTASGAFYQLLNAGKASVALDLSVAAGCDQLKQLLLQADIVLEGSRPRALRQMGIEAEQLLLENPTLTWVSITGYGRSDPQADWVAFGDDAAVAAGVAAATASPPLFCGDALADPLTGLHAACAALAYWRAGGGVLLDLSLCDVTAHCLAFAPELQRARLECVDQSWSLVGNGQRCQVASPQSRLAAGPAASLGEDTMTMLREFRISC